MFFLNPLGLDLLLVLSLRVFYEFGMLTLTPQRWSFGRPYQIHSKSIPVLGRWVERWRNLDSKAQLIFSWWVVLIAAAFSIFQLVDQASCQLLVLPRAILFGLTRNKQLAAILLWLRFLEEVPSAARPCKARLADDRTAWVFWCDVALPGTKGAGRGNIITNPHRIRLQNVYVVLGGACCNGPRQCH